jgi:hypothetical protein
MSCYIICRVSVCFYLYRGTGDGVCAQAQDDGAAVGRHRRSVRCHPGLGALRLPLRRATSVMHVPTRTHTYPHVPTVISCTRSHAHVPSPTHTYVVVTLPHNPLCSHLHGCYKTLWALAVADSPEAHGLLTMTFSLMSPAALRSGPSV